LQATLVDFNDARIAHITPRKARVYAAMMLALDRGVGTILAALKHSGMEENTMVMFTSDNGAPGYIGELSNTHTPVLFCVAGWM
jgi:arylsulfatase A-like enzyme